MFCGKCGTKMADTDCFCPGCGNKVQEPPVHPVPAESFGTGVMKKMSDIGVAVKDTVASDSRTASAGTQAVATSKTSNRTILAVLALAAVLAFFSAFMPWVNIMPRLDDTVKFMQDFLDNIEKAAGSSDLEELEDFMDSVSLEEMEEIMGNVSLEDLESLMSRAAMRDLENLAGIWGSSEIDSLKEAKALLDTHLSPVDVNSMSFALEPGALLFTLPPMLFAMFSLLLVWLCLKTKHPALALLPMLLATSPILMFTILLLAVSAVTYGVVNSKLMFGIYLYLFAFLTAIVCHIILWERLHKAKKQAKEMALYGRVL